MSAEEKYVSERAEGSKMLSTLTEEAYQSYLKALLAGERLHCRKTVDGVLESNRTIHELYEEVFRRSLYEIGQLWEYGRISVADEHLATAMTESLLTQVYPFLFETSRIERSAVVSCMANEYHQIGGKMVADTFEMHGWDSYFLGANTPLTELLKMVDKKQPEVIALSLTIYSGMPSLTQAIESLRKQFADLEIWVGGQAFRWSKKLPGKDDGVFLIESLSTLESRLVNWKKEP